ncbi:glycosyltransferase [Bacillus infantis]|uniref:glycosyltransferase n=1 Tax=Bacillus infantis TaxID=324767 RepID=UPI0021558DE2|nr:glycosyltransferase [Bacillus infantis]MCR6613464.1 glycosyltransferase [Bacillus infantis]
MLVFPSPTETFENVVLEALSSGTPAVVADKGGPAEIISDGRTAGYARQAAANHLQIPYRSCLEILPSS